MTWLLFGLSWLRKAFSALLSIVTRYPWQAALVAALAFGAWQTMGKREAISDRDALAVRLVQQRAEFIAASEEAERLAIAAKAAAEQRYKERADATDRQAETALADARSRADAYVRRMRAEVTCRSPGQTSPAPNGGDPQSPVGPGEDAFVAVTRDDFDALVENTIRLNEAHKWALTLNQEPVPAVKF